MCKQASYIVLFSKTQSSWQLDTCHYHASAFTDSATPPFAKILLPFHSSLLPTLTELRKDWLPIFDCIPLVHVLYQPQSIYLMPLPFSSTNSQVSAYSHTMKIRKVWALSYNPLKSCPDPIMAHCPWWTKLPPNSKWISDVFFFWLICQFWTVPPLDCWRAVFIFSSWERSIIWGCFF